MVQRPPSITSSIASGVSVRRVTRKTSRRSENPEGTGALYSAPRGLLRTEFDSSWNSKRLWRKQVAARLVTSLSLIKGKTSFPTRALRMRRLLAPCWLVATTRSMRIASTPMRLHCSIRPAALVRQRRPVTWAALSSVDALGLRRRSKPQPKAWLLLGIAAKG